MIQKMEPDEYIYFIFRISDQDFYMVTDKRIAKKKKSEYVEASLKQIVSIGEPEVRMGFLSHSTCFRVNTYQGEIAFEFDAISDSVNCGTFLGKIRIAFQNHHSGTPDQTLVGVKARLNSPEDDSQLCPKCGKQLTSEYNYCPYCEVKLK